MRLRLIAMLTLLATPAFAATSPAGDWWTQDHDGVIRIAPCAEGMCGTIVGMAKLVDSKGQKQVDNHGAPRCHLTILRGKPDGDAGHYSGTITDPQDGKDWHSEFWLDPDGSLRLRGYVLMPLLGQTQTWPPFHGSVAADCAITGG
jgi:uncharacterized protein (DUF2147 family)